MIEHAVQLINNSFMYNTTTNIFCNSRLLSPLFIYYVTRSE